MKNHRLLRILAFISSIGVVGVFYWSDVFAQSTTINVHVGPLIIDVCPNILGPQALVPDGMIIDEAGNCVTPPPPAIDVCANLPGDQATIPVGYYRDDNGDCHPQPSPPIDVCPNLFGIQSVVPSSLIVDANGNCVAPPVDECPNIDGPQSSVPIGMVKVDSVCFTPHATVDPPAEVAPPSGSTQPTGTKYKNIPTFLDPIVDPIVNLIPEKVKQTLKSIPAEVSRTVPYYIYATLGAAAGILFLQALREMRAANALLVLLKREKSVAEQKDNFIALASHYLRTPLTLMRNGLDTIVALKEAGSKTVEPLRAAIDRLEINIKDILSDIESDEALRHISPPPADSKPQSLRSPFFWGPALGSILLTLIANFLLGVVADVDLGMANLLFQLIVMVAIIMVFYTALRNHHIRSRQRKQQQQLITHERAIDSARNEFIQRSTAALQAGLGELYLSRSSINSAASARFFDEGYLRFNSILDKFILLSKIQNGDMTAIEQLNLRKIVNSILKTYHSEIDDKRLTITNEISPTITVKQNRDLLEFVVRSIIDNAIKFNANGGQIIIKADKSTHQLTIKISDTGIGIPKDKLTQLFKPFSRAGSAVQFNYEGLGFSLFLDKIITDHMGGGIAAASTKDKGTHITVRAHAAHA